jgi:hypothetical protein
MPVPFNPPNQVLFALLGFVTDSARGVVRTTFEKMQDQNPNQPVGTTLALMEQGMTVFSAIHARLHNSMQMTLRVLHRLNKMNLTDDYIEKVTGEEMCKAEDFRGPMDVIPVSDPNIFSEAQRFAQVQAVAQRAAAQPNIYDPYKVEELILSQLKVPDYKSLLKKQPEPIELNAVNENLALTLGRPVAAFPMQDHLAHLQVHLDYLQSPMFGMNPLIGPVFIPGVLQHIKEHMAYWYSLSMYEGTSMAVGMPLDVFLEKKDEEVSAEMDRTLAMASQKFMPEIQKTLAGVPPVIQKAMQVMSQMGPKQPVDPAQLLQAETERKAAYDQGKLALDQARLDREAQLDVIKQQEKEAEIAAKIAMNREDNLTAKELAVFEAEQGIKTPYSTGRGINP